MRLARLFRVFVLVFFAACASGRPEAILFGVDACAYCLMQISDARFAAAVVTVKGRTIKFDSIECLRAYLDKDGARTNIASIWVSDFQHPDALLSADRAWFVDLGPGRAPMGKSGHSWVAIPSPEHAAALGVAPSAAKRWSDIS